MAIKAMRDVTSGHLRSSGRTEHLCLGLLGTLWFTRGCHVWRGDRRLTPGGGLRYRAPPGIFSDAQAFGHHFRGGHLYGGPRKLPGYGDLSKGPP